MPDSGEPIRQAIGGLPLGTHVIAEFYGASQLSDADQIHRVMIKAAEHAGAIVLDARFHTFGDGQGVTGVVVLAESHISIHTWPESGYAAIDAFMCGEAMPEHAVDYLCDFFSPTDTEIKVFKRGVPGTLTETAR